MTNLIGENAEQLRAIARRRRVRRLAVFGSALTDQFDVARSDIDVVVEFDELAPGERADAYFSLLEDLESIFGRRVDLVERAALRNPFVRESVEATQVVIYDAA
ncbi:MAG TPA: nucleotidyltransferase domain-containing protein [Thermoanaerobaculaceae bacterium]|nr:nucleotidyltransferase domain-containing protein [Thermoanaerobaculaceae bacterium]